MTTYRSRMDATAKQLDLIETLHRELIESRTITPEQLPFVLSAEFGVTDVSELTSLEATALIGRMRSRLDASYGPAVPEDDTVPFR